MKLIAKSLADLPQIAKQVIEFAQQEKIWVLNGQMGAGKTTFSKVLCRELGVEENVSSPTFSIVNEYRVSDDTVYHYDFYRLKNQNEALDMGVEDYFCSGSWNFIEWPEKIMNLLPENVTVLELSLAEDGSRILKISEKKLSDGWSKK